MENHLNMNYVGNNVCLEDNVILGRNVIILGNTVIGSNTIIEDNVIISKPSDSQLKNLTKYDTKNLIDYYEASIDTDTVIKNNCIIGSHSTIYSGTKIKQNTICKDYTLIGWDTIINENTKIMYSAQIHSWVQIGEGCRIGGFCCNDSIIGNDVSMYGNLLHAYREFGGGRRDPAPLISDKVTVGFGANIIGDITIGENSYIAAGTIASRDVPPNTMVTAVNEQCHFNSWKGLLRNYRDFS